MYDRVGTELIEQAKHVNIVTYLRAKHPDSVQFAAHPDVPQYKCWRGVEHDSITFYGRDDENGDVIYRYTRWANVETDDGAGYLVRYEGYKFPQAVRALCDFKTEEFFYD